MRALKVRAGISRIRPEPGIVAVVIAADYFQREVDGLRSGSARRDRRRRDCRACLQRGMAGLALSRRLFDKVQPWVLEFMAITDIACTLRSTIMLPAVAKNFLK